MKINESNIVRKEDVSPKVWEMCDALDKCIKESRRLKTEKAQIQVIGTATALVNQLVKENLPVPRRIYNLSLMGIIYNGRAGRVTGI